MTRQIKFDLPSVCEHCTPYIEKLKEIHKNRKPYMDIKLGLFLTRDILGRDYWHIHTLEIQSSNT